MRTFLLACFALLGTALGAKAQGNAEYNFFGSPCTSVPWQPTPFVNRSLPRIGGVLQIETLSSSSGFGFAYDIYVLTGVSRTSWLGVPLPFDASVLTTIGFFSCGNLYVSADWVEHMPIFATQQPILLSYPVPPFPSLIGMRLYQQVVEHYRDRFDEELYFTRAAEAVIGI